MLEVAASEAMKFVTFLANIQFQESWMRYTFSVPVESAAISLRYPIESNGVRKKASYITPSVAFRNQSRTAWDALQCSLAYFYLERCDEPIQRIV
jgi:hypothetical protein